MEMELIATDTALTLPELLVARPMESLQQHPSSQFAFSIAMVQVLSLV
jgi:hypothetical protein